MQWLDMEVFGPHRLSLSVCGCVSVCVQSHMWCARHMNFHCFYLIFEALCLIWAICLCLSISWLSFNLPAIFSISAIRSFIPTFWYWQLENQNIYSSFHIHSHRTPSLCISFRIHSYACNFRRSLINQIDFAKVKYILTQTEVVRWRAGMGWRE